MVRERYAPVQVAMGDAGECQKRSGDARVAMGISGNARDAKGMLGNTIVARECQGTLVKLFIFGVYLLERS